MFYYFLFGGVALGSPDHRLILLIRMLKLAFRVRIPTALNLNSEQVKLYNSTALCQRFYATELGCRHCRKPNTSWSLQMREVNAAYVDLLVLFEASGATQTSRRELMYPVCPSL